MTKKPKVKDPKNSNTKKTNKKVKKKFKFLKIMSLTILILCVLLGITAGCLSLAVIKTSPDLNINEIIASSEASKIYDSNGTLMDNIITDKKKFLVKYEDIPQNLVNAVVSIEDERFFEHKGIDIKRIAGALFIDIKNMIHGRSSLQGASTITQQLLKNTLYTTRDKSFTEKVKRKIQEWYLAPKLEKKIGKKSIMAAYLNTIYLGGRAIGVEAAAQQYFGTSIKNLNLIQCAFIAGLPQSPSIYYPYSRTSRKDPSKYINRTKTVLGKMKENGYINANEYNASIAELNLDKNTVTNKKDVQVLGRTIINKVSAKNDKYNFEWFSRAVVDDVRADLKKIYNYSDEEIENLLINGNLKIHTTMDRKLQIATQKILNEDSKLKNLAKNDEKGLLHPQSSAVLTDYHTGEVKVIIGGRGEQPAMSYNRAIHARVPSGSSIKPLTVYSPAIDSKSATAATVLEDSPLQSSMAKKYGSKSNPWQPKNSNGRYSGYLNLREGLKHSVNVYAVKLEDKIGLNTGIKYGEKFGLTFNNIDKHSPAAIALGELNHGTNTFTMANAYGVFGNNGLYTTPRLYTKVEDKNGNILLETKVETSKVLSPEAAYIMYDLLKGPVNSGTATHLKDSYRSNIPIAGKTGTSSFFKNLWFCGLTPYYSGSVWIENKYKQRIYSRDAAYLLGKIMNEAVKDLPNKDIPMPSNIVTRSVDRVSGLLPSELSYRDPRGSQVYNELFIRGTVPNTYDNIHVEAKINKLNGKLAGPFTPEFLTISKVFIRRDYNPGVTLGDSMYVLPKQYDPTSSTVPEPNPDNKPDEEENTGDNDNIDDNTPPDTGDNQNPDDNNDTDNDNTPPDDNTDNNTPTEPTDTNH